MDDNSSRDVIDNDKQTDVPMNGQELTEDDMNNTNSNDNQMSDNLIDGMIDGDNSETIDVKITNDDKVVKVCDIKNNKRGIVYMSYIPPGLNVNRLRQMMSEYGEVERIFLQKEKPMNESDKKSLKKKNKKKDNPYNCRFVEGWIEFKKKSVAKLVAQILNGKQIGGKRRTLFYDQIWSLKYLHKFKWSHLAEQLSYEKALRQQKLRFEITRAKKETDFYERMTQKFKYNSRHKKSNDDNNADDKTSDNRKYKQWITDEVIRKNKTIDSEVDFELLNKIFG